MKNLTQRLWYAVLLFCGLFVLSGVTDAATFPKNSKLYFQPSSNWLKDSAKFVAKFGSNQTQHQFTLVSGESNIYQVTVPSDADYSVVHILRLNPANNQEWNYRSNLQAKDGKDLIILDNDWDGDNSGYSWGTYSSGGGSTPTVWSHYSLRGSGDDYGAGKRAELTWNSTNKRYEGTVTVDADTWVSKITVGSSSSNKDEEWYGPSSEQTVDNTMDFGVQINGSEIKFKKGTYNLSLKTEGDLQGKNPKQLYITGGGGGSIYIYGNFSGANNTSNYSGDSWRDPYWRQLTQMENVPDVYEFRFSANQDGQVYFRINHNGTIYAPTTFNDYEIPVDNESWVATKSNSEAGAFFFEAEKNHTYYIKYSTNTHNLTIYDANFVQRYYLAGGFLSNWSYRLQFEPTAENPKVLKLTARYNEANKKNAGFKITTFKKSSVGKWYSLGGSEADSGRKDYNTNYNIADKAEQSNMFLHRSAYGKDVTYTLTLDNNGKPSTLRFEWEGHDLPVLTYDLPVYPIGVYTESGLEKYDDWPVVYLLGGTLNNDRVTPEYQMTKKGTDHYELEFTARNTQTGTSANDYFGAGQLPMSVVAYNDAKSAKVIPIAEFTKDFDKGEWKEGVRYKAILKKENGAWELELKLLDTEKRMPFLSMVGANWQQRIKATTPDGKSTNDGWQEAWIQYDNRGQVALNRGGEVMYNTMWPPRNPILFKTEFDFNGKKDFTLSSKDLTFVPGETKTGAEWLKEYAGKGYSTYNVTNNKKPNDGKEFHKQLALDPSRKYTRYRVEDMWINGRVKIWSGWSGYRDSNNGDAAIWSWHANWGHYGHDTAPVEISSESTVPLFNRDGDVQFANPTFFKYVDFFYDCSDPQGEARSMFFTELAQGGAQIAALSTDNYTHGNYQAALNNISNILDKNITKVVINCYQTVSNGDTESDEMVGNVLTWTGTKNVKLFHEIFAGEPNNEGLSSTGSTDESTHSTGKWVKDETQYPNGDYFYKMEVYISGQSEPITVTSNPFTIFNDNEPITINVYQLVKIEDIPKELSESGSDEGHYVTYKGKSVDEPNVPVFPVYELWIENDTKFDGNANNVYDENGNVIGYIDDEDFKYRYRSISEMPDYDTYKDTKFGHTYFTDKVLIAGSVPSADQVDGYKFAAGDATSTPETSRAKIGEGPMKAIDTQEWDKSRLQPEYGDRFMFVTNVGTFNKREFNLQMKYSTSFIDAETGELVNKTGEITEAVPATYQAVIPEPILKEAEVKVYYGESINNDDDNNSVGTFKYKGLSLPNARYTNVSDHVVVEYPNVSRFLKERIIKEGIFTLKLDLVEDEKNDVTTWDNIYTFGLNGEEDNENNTAAVVSQPMTPDVFLSRRAMELIKDEEKGYAYFSRGWEDADLPLIEVSDNRPITFAHNVAEKVYDSANNFKGDAHIYRDGEGHIISEYTINVMHDDTYEPTEAYIEPEKPQTGDHNYIMHEASGVDKSGNPITVTHNHLLRHNNALYRKNVNRNFEDYYYVAVIDYDEDQLGPLSNEIVDDAASEKSFNLDDYIIDDKGKKNGEEGFNESTKLHFVVPASEILNGNSKPITVRKDYGEISAEGSVYDAKVEEISKNHFSKNIKVLVSYLYPFSIEKSEPVAEDTPSAAPGQNPNRAAKVIDGSVIKSKADIWNSPDLSDGNIVTSVSNLNSDMLGGLNVGKGFIEVSGDGVRIMDASGVVIGLGEGRYDVTPGVYMVRYNGKTTKVVVR